MAVQELKELTDEELDVELKCAVFIDDVRHLCSTVKLPESVIEEKFVGNENMPLRIVRTIFCHQPLSQKFLMKYINLFHYNWLLSNPYLCENQELLDGIRVVKKMTEEEET